MSNVHLIKEIHSQASNTRLAELLALCEQGNDSALAELYKQCAAQLYGVQLRILKVEAIAEEALQDCFVKIWQKSGTYNSGAGTPMVWLCSIARHQALDVLRKRSVREGNEVTDVFGYIDSTPDLSKPLHEMSDDVNRLMRCLDELSEEAHSCIVKAYCEGYSHEELADQCDTPIGTVKSWIRRGLVSLKTCIDEH